MITLKCPKHPRYNARTYPRASCEICIQIHHVKTEFDNMVQKRVRTPVDAVTWTSPAYGPTERD